MSVLRAKTRNSLSKKSPATSAATARSGRLSLRPASRSSAQGGLGSPSRMGGSKSQRRRTGKTRLFTSAPPSLASMFGDTPTTSITATRARNISKPSSITSSIGSFLNRPKARRLPEGRCQPACGPGCRLVQAKLRFDQGLHGLEPDYDLHSENGRRDVAWKVTCGTGRKRKSSSFASVLLCSAGGASSSSFISWIARRTVLLLQ